MPFKSLILLSAINACLTGVIFAFVFLAAILTLEIAPDAGWSTVPVTSFVIGAAVCIIPISMLMESRGRRVGFLAGALSGCLASLAIVLADRFDSFATMCLAGFFVGGLTASAGFLRFAGLELSKPEKHGTAASIVLSGGIVASFFGTRLPLLVSDIAKVELFEALGISILAFSGVALFLVLFLPRLQIGHSPEPGPPRLAVIDMSLFGNARFRQGVAACAGGYAVMTLLMSAAPLHVTDILGLPIETAEQVMRSHFMAMFVPFLFSGVLLDRVGGGSLAVSGIALNVTAVILLLSGSSGFHLHGALITLGVGWNFLFLSGTTILQSSLEGNQLHSGQRMNELSLSAGNALASAAAGTLIYTLGLLSLLAIASVVCLLILAPYAFALVSGNASRR